MTMKYCWNFYCSLFFQITSHRGIKNVTNNICLRSSHWLSTAHYTIPNGWTIKMSNFTSTFILHTSIQCELNSLVFTRWWWWWLGCFTLAKSAGFEIDLLVNANECRLFVQQKIWKNAAINNFSFSFIAMLDGSWVEWINARLFANTVNGCVNEERRRKNANSMTPMETSWNCLFIRG